MIQRVSRLFHGNPNLIQGFNTFLPVGYRIDISDPLDSNTITVTTPSGTTTQNINNIYGLQRGSIPLGYGAPSNMIGGTLSRSLTPHALHFHAQPPFDPAYSPGFQNPQTTAAASFLGNLNGRDQVGKQPAGEFNHAIQYLNKIKARYADDNNTYKQFLDILQTYQKEQRNIHDVSSVVRFPLMGHHSTRSIYRSNFYSRIRSTYWQNSEIFFLRQPQLCLARTASLFYLNLEGICSLPRDGTPRTPQRRLLPSPPRKLPLQLGAESVPQRRTTLQGHPIG